jgi:probable HAF family extracellular repeat protein
LKIASSFKLQGLILAAALSVAFVTPVSAQEQQRAFIVDLNSKKVTDLGTLGGSYSEAHAINAAAQVAGVSTTSAGTHHAFITGPNGVGMTDLGTLGASDSYANGINDAGRVVGYYQNQTGAGGSPRAFITGPNGIGMTDLGTLGGWQGYSAAYGINTAGRVVGGSDTAAGPIDAFITGPNGVGMTDLNTLISLAGGIVLTEARGINNRGQVIAIGMMNAVPEPETCALLLAGLGLIGFMARRRKAV